MASKNVEYIVCWEQSWLIVCWSFEYGTQAELGTILKKCIIDTITITHFFLIIDTNTITLKKIIVDTITNTEFS